MRIYEVVSNQNIVNEQILTEIDWKKLRNALIGGAMSLAVLGAPGKAIAQSLDANKITPDQAIELIQKKVASGEIRQDQIADVMSGRKAEIDRLNQLVKPGQIKPIKLKADPDDFYAGSGDTDRYLLDNLPFPVNKIGMITKGPASGLVLPNPQHPLHKHFSQTVEQWSKFLEPGDSTAPQKAYIKWRMSTDDAVVKNIKQDEPKKDTKPSVHTGNFMMKGVKFGMTMEEVLDALEKQYPDRGSDLGKWIDRKIYSRDSGVMTVDFSSLLGVYGSSGTLDAKLNFSKDEGLYQIIIDEKPEVIEKLVDRLIQKFGNPNKFYDTRWQNQAGTVYPNKFFMWDNVNGAVIKGTFRGDTRDKGNIAFVSAKSYQNALDFKQKYTKDKVEKDF